MKDRLEKRRQICARFRTRHPNSHLRYATCEEYREYERLRRLAFGRADKRSPELANKAQRKYQLAHRERITAYILERRRTNPEARIHHNLSRRLRGALRAAGTRKLRTSTEKLLGCSYQFEML